eukprot:gnl/Ergobibamus_cyprinoides/964.p2 GENE.gnl/Ergobibamus_cyprinoides/964~~gnl/Ergobibamus_cyprinoides/964.p2  ORF type:complete len:202 (+),score=24.33 gnl/Ergobibamus_cyprinoides/964:263-868(+)
MLRSISHIPAVHVLLATLRGWLDSEETASSRTSCRSTSRATSTPRLSRSPSPSPRRVLEAEASTLFEEARRLDLQLALQPGPVPPPAALVHRRRALDAHLADLGAPTPREQEELQRAVAALGGRETQPVTPPLDPPAPRGSARGEDEEARQWRERAARLAATPGVTAFTRADEAEADLARLRGLCDQAEAEVARLHAAFVY